MKFSRYSSKVMAYVMALFQRQHFCLSNKTTTMCGCPARIVRLLPIRHDRIGEFTENKMRLAPTLMCRLTVHCKARFSLSIRCSLLLINRALIPSIIFTPHGINLRLRAVVLRAVVLCQ